ITAIFTHNLTGVDIDTRARQLSCFALLLKACQIDNTFANAQVMPNVLDMPEPYTATDLQAVVTDYLIDADTTTIMQVINAIELMKHAYNLGSIMKFELSAESRAFVARCTEEWLQQPRIPAEIQNMMHYMRILLALTDKYAAVAMNPPYMSNGNMNGILSQYVKENYEKGKADLCTAFILMQKERTMLGGYYANIIPPSWMFITTFADFRKEIIDNQSIQSMLHLSRGVFGADFGSVSTIIQNRKDANSRGTYFRLIERTFQEFDQRHLKILFEKTLANHDFRYFFANYSKEVTDIVYSDKGSKVYYPDVPQTNFKKIPGCTLLYFISEKYLRAFTNYKTLGSLYKTITGSSTGENATFLRYWHEVELNKIGLNIDSGYDGYGYKWIPCVKGGSFRRWYGNLHYLINWNNNGEELKAFATFKNHGKHWSRFLKSLDCFYKSGITWAKVLSGKFSARYMPDGCIMESAGCAIMPGKDNELYLLALMNTSYVQKILDMINPTMGMQAGDIMSIPFNYRKETKQLINELSKDCLTLSKEDWDAHETSWDFQENELIRLFKQGLGTIRVGFENAPKNNFVALDLLVEEYKAYWMDKFNQLHHNEEELNRQFIEIYGLQDELSPNVPYDEVTILQQGEIMFIPAPGSENCKTPIWCEDNVIQQLISYAVGCYMGRYRLDRPGLHIAHPNPTAEELQPYEVSCLASRSPESFIIDEDAIIPILPRDCGFPDNMLRRITNFIEQVFGSNNLVANLNYIESALGKSLEDYLSKDFWKDHVKRYQKRPIYWLFSSKKGAFKAIAYMHRMDAFTVATIRNHYLLPYINTLETRIDALRVRQAELTTPERRNLERLTKDLDDCREYDLRLHQVADRQITIDLDDGVVRNYALFGDVLSKL
ncbi:MAG: BREX-1 system adenine-specific DNA-methyltransferase PglX, partial [Bacteroidales bacterium]|nr:BREX-1 system adenine-specific DNA-methyltransferase PglX [Bacteroidales bacterium]